MPANTAIPELGLIKAMLYGELIICPQYRVQVRALPISTLCRLLLARCRPVHADHKTLGKISAVEQRPHKTWVWIIGADFSGIGGGRPERRLIFLISRCLLFFRPALHWADLGFCSTYAASRASRRIVAAAGGAINRLNPDEGAAAVYSK